MMAERESNPPLNIVARGKIKVDARKAIRKLRDHMLVDLHLYACEIARVAVAVGARTLDVTWDSDDLILTFDGRALPAQAIVRARDHVLAPEMGVDDGDALRVLGIGVSAALGLDPRFVDVTTADAAGCTRVRFEAKHIEEEGGAAAPEMLAVALPEAMPRPGMRVHVRKKVRLGDLGRLVRGDAPREVALLVHATRDAPLRVTISGAPVARTAGPAVLLRVDLDEPSIARGTLEILAQAPDVAPRTLFLDLGVHLAETGSIGVREGVTSELPIRIVVDSRKLPTNASRSAVQVDSDIVRRVRGRVPSALAAALSTLQAIVMRGEAAPRPGRLSIGHSVEVLEPRRDVLEEALGALAADVAITMRAGHHVSPEEEALLSLPLLRDAVGRPMTLGSLRGGTMEHPLLVYSGAAPAPAELAPWLEGVVWRRGRAAERAFGVLAQASADERVAQARDGHVRRARAMEHQASRAELGTSASYLLKEAFHVTEGDFAGLVGEVAIVRRESGYRRASIARLFVDDRLLEEVQLPGVALPLDMALSWPSVLRARAAYDGVERDDSVTRAVLYALRIAALAVGERLGPRDPELARLAIHAFAGASRDLGDRTPMTKSLGKLASAAVWPTTDGGMTSLGALDSYTRRTGALCVAPAGAGPAADGRPVVVTAHGKALLGLLPEPTILIDYARTLARGKEAVSSALAEQARETSVKVTIEREHSVGFVGVGPNRRRVLHGGEVLRDEPHVFRNGPVLVVVEDRAAVPRNDYEELLWSSPGSADSAREEDALLEVVVEGCARGDLELAIYEEYLATALRKVSDRLSSGGKAARQDDIVALHARLVALPERIKRAVHARAKAIVLARPIHASRSLPLPRLVSAYDVTPAPASGRSSPLKFRLPTSSGVVIASLLRGQGSRRTPAEVLFEGHPVGATAASFPLAMVVDVARETLLDGFVALTAEGETWAHDSAVEAVLRLIEELARRDDFTSDLDALGLCERLIEDEAQLTSRVAGVLRTARWPTVQGETSIPGVSTTLHVGSVAYAPYLTAEATSPYDAPALCLPAGSLGDLRRRLLESVGYSLTDVSEEIARLQARRARGAGAPAPQLPGAPLHAELRASLAELGATLAEGELEIAEDETVALARVDERGAVQPFRLPLAHPVRAVFRAGEVDREALAAELDAATVRHLRALVPSLDRLPAFVRGRVRAIVCEAVRSGERHAGDDDANVFLDVRGYTWSLARLREVGVRQRTSDPGPWPTSLEGYEAAALIHLGDAEAAALSRMLRFEDVTTELRERALGETRRGAPPVPSLALPPELRAKCIFVVALEEEGGMRGEIGLLRPAYASLRAIAVHATMRLVAVIEDRDGWPTVAMIDVDDLETTRAFDALPRRADVSRIQRRVRMGVSACARTLLEVPPDVLGVIRLPMPFLARPSRPAEAGAAEPPIACLGAFWLEKTWPDAPTVQIESFDGTDPFRVPHVAVAPGAHHGVLPIAGRLFVCAGQRELQPALEAVFRSVLERLVPVVARACGAHGTAPEELAAYVWDLRLLGARRDADPVEELARDRPDGSLMRVAARRAVGLIDRATGDVTPGENANANANANFFSGLVRRVVELVTTPERGGSSPLTDAMLKGLLAMKLTGGPVEAVVEVRRGRPVRYEARRRTVFVNMTHDTVRALEAHPSRVLVLLSAAVSEINRELVPVTDAEELAVIVDLLRDGPT